MSPDPTPNPEPTRGGLPEHAPERPRPGALSKHDPRTDNSATNRPPLLLVIIIVVVVTAFVVLHLTGVLGGSH